MANKYWIISNEAMMYKSDLAEQASKAHRLLFIRNDLFYTYKNQNALLEARTSKRRIRWVKPYKTTISIHVSNLLIVDLAEIVIERSAILINGN